MSRYELGKGKEWGLLIQNVHCAGQSASLQTGTPAASRQVSLKLWRSDHPSRQHLSLGCSMRMQAH